ncbi:hypothetical protein O0L34_g7591 [Tuta absoluta]|nr:hypothetical protein O0L34_g7591 [Tuta absoluta]
MQQSTSQDYGEVGVLRTDLQKSGPEPMLYQDFVNTDEDCKPLSQIKEDAPSDIEEGSEGSEEVSSSEEETTQKNNKKGGTPALRKAKAVIKTQRLKIRTLNQQIRRAQEKINLQNKVLNDLMEIYGLKHEDIAVLKSEILRAQKLESQAENAPET